MSVSGKLVIHWHYSTQGEMLATSIFSFSHNVFYSSRGFFVFLRLSFLDFCQSFSIWTGLKFSHKFNPFPNKPWFLRVYSTSLLKTLWEKEKLLVTSNFSFSHSVFYPSKELSAIFIKFEIIVCKLFQFGRV